MHWGCPAMPVRPRHLPLSASWQGSASASALSFQGHLALQHYLRGTGGKCRRAGQQLQKPNLLVREAHASAAASLLFWSCPGPELAIMLCWAMLSFLWFAHGQSKRSGRGIQGRAGWQIQLPFSHTQRGLNFHLADGETEAEGSISQISGKIGLLYLYVCKRKRYTCAQLKP